MRCSLKLTDYNPFTIRTECYAGYRGEQEPLRFFLGEREVTVLEIMDRWLAPTHRYFKVRGNDHGTYILRYDCDKDCWELTHFSSLRHKALTR